jgi:hypothetical protein
LSEHPSDTHQGSKKHANQNSRDYFLWSLTPELTGAGGPAGPQGTNIGHQNREAMANVGVRVERFVRLGREVEGFHSNSVCNFWHCTSCVTLRFDKLNQVVFGSDE